MNGYLEIFATFAGLLPIVNPFSTAVVFLSISRGMSPQRQRQQIRMACIYMIGILVTFLFAGTFIMDFFGISLPGVRIAGGFIVFGIGMGMLRAEPEAKVSKETEEEASKMTDIAFTPLAMPMMSGPGAIAVTLTMAADVDSFRGDLRIAIGIILVALVCAIVLHFASRVVKFMGKTGVTALTRIMGFLLVAISIQFVFFGIFDVLTNEKFWKPIMEAIHAAMAT